ncbi:MAG: 2OG-Fe dioxygenase family protein, partial [Gammaproteobacteria bacterium]
GYSFALDNAICLSPDMEGHWEELRGDWNHLPADACLKDSGRYRFRRYDRFFFRPVSGDLRPLPHTAFFQGKGFNKLHGGIKREFAALRKLTFDNIFLRELIKFDFSQFSPKSTTMQKPWEVGIHEIRIVAEPAAAGKPTPEGPHRDGYKFIAMHLIRRQNILGGVTTICDKRKQPLQALTLLDPLDSVYVEDSRVIHDVTPIYSEKNNVPGIRDMLIVTYDYHPRLERER